MADTVTSSDIVTLTWNFEDGDTRAMTIKDPSPSLTVEDIKDFGTWTATNQILIGDKRGSNLSISKPIIKAIRKNAYKISVDLT